MKKEAPKKGAALEEVLRLYFLKAGHFVVRGVPFAFDGNDLTDVDLWMYERPTGASRRISAVDAKSKQKPRAVERVLWTKGLVAALGLDGAYVATTDQRPFLRELASKLSLSVIDGADLKRIQMSSGLGFEGRLTDEELIERIQAVDKSLRSKELQSERSEVRLGIVSARLRMLLAIVGVGGCGSPWVSGGSYFGKAVLSRCGDSGCIVGLSLCIDAVSVCRREARNDGACNSIWRIEHR